MPPRSYFSGPFGLQHFLSDVVPRRIMASFAKKRRLLREHRAQMRIMDAIIQQHDLADDLSEETLHVTGNTGFWLGFDDEPGGMDEESDGEDPEAALRREVEELRREAADRQAFVAAVQGALDNDALRVGLERARMQLDDHR